MSSYPQGPPQHRLHDVNEPLPSLGSRNPVSQSHGVNTRLNESTTNRHTHYQDTSNYSSGLDPCPPTTQGSDPITSQNSQQLSTHSPDVYPRMGAVRGNGAPPHRNPANVGGQGATPHDPQRSQAQFQQATHDSQDYAYGHGNNAYNTERPLNVHPTAAGGVAVGGRSDLPIGKANLADKIVGKTEKVMGKVLKDTEMHERGELRESGGKAVTRGLARAPHD